MQLDLNALKIGNADGPDEPLRDYGVVSQDGSTQVLFKGLEGALIELIDQADVVVGCVAWLTSKPILRALARKESVSIVVQKEDFLRPDLGAGDNWRRELRAMYAALRCNLSRYDEFFRDTVLYAMSYAGDPSIDPVRCVGNHNADRRSAFPRCHHKFVVFCKYQNVEVEEMDWEQRPPVPRLVKREIPVPYAVWTGSFNFTKNAGASFENAVILRDPAVVRAFLQEYAQVTALSEPLDWSSDWVEPEWRIGS